MKKADDWEVPVRAENTEVRHWLNPKTILYIQQVRSYRVRFVLDRRLRRLAAEMPLPGSDRGGTCAYRWQWWRRLSPHS